ncbi:anti-phage dCTP deaminase [uncultured Cohaesibacter sp.]|uniref:anti-phage dCTP deaminase n=1 Tax=uncultured Cohaesibacter sp. TaxID=1002546 RepID=UPI00292D5736|nr:anti-phage dCTP deaminase [uncultured Cohaesibacter sp.]
MTKEISRIKQPPIIIGLVAPLGVDINPIIKSFEKEFEGKGYRSTLIKVTDYFKEILPDFKCKENPTYSERIVELIKAGNEICKTYNDPAILARLCVKLISESNAETERGLARGTRKVYIVRQFKREDEVGFLRSIYGNLFFQVSIFSNRKKRLEYLTQSIADSQYQIDAHQFTGDAQKLIERDEREKDNDFGQQVGKIFHHADYLINADVQEGVETQVQRFVNLLFGSNFISPTREEYGMFLAASAALRTLDLSRQVGAAVFSPTSEIISMGCNEVPKGGGGSYWADAGGFDARDYKLGQDPNEKRKVANAVDILKRLQKEHIIKEDIAVTDLVEDDVVKESLMMDVLEFGRIVHAEMMAITDAARAGKSLKDATLYCTTFPCHMCAKHIVASGITRVVYLEPYPKSSAIDLHGDSIQTDETGDEQYKDFEKATFSHFCGITPRRYMELFHRGKRKGKAGNVQEWAQGVPEPVVNIHIPSYAGFETIVATDFDKEIAAKFEEYASANKLNK